MKYKIEKKLIYSQPKNVDLKFLEPGDIIEFNNCGDFDVNADVVLLNFKVDYGKERNTIKFNVIMPNGEATDWYEIFYKNEPSYLVIGKAEIKKVSEENAPTL